MSTKFTLLAAAIVLCTPLCSHGEVTYGSVQNGGFDGNRTLRPDDSILAVLSQAQWKISGELVFPRLWQPNPNTPGGTFEYVRSGGWQQSPFVRLGGGGHLSTGYFGTPEPKKAYIGSVRVRGKGKVSFGGSEYGEHAFLGETMFVQRDVATKKWTEYRGVYGNKDPNVKVLHLFVTGQGPVDVDEVQLKPAEPADVEITREMSGMYGTGALIEDPDVLAVRADKAYQSRLAEFHAAFNEFRKNRAKVEIALLASVEKKVAALDPYLCGEGKTAVLAARHNDMVALTRVLKKQTGTDPGLPTPIPTEAAASGAGYKPGERVARPNAVTVTDVRSDKIRYDENERATTVATLVNATSSLRRGTLAARMIVGLDDAREIARTPATLNQGANQWRFTYDVGPETYGRAIEVRFLDESGKILDQWQEYCAVAAEWFRVQQHAAGQAGLKSYRTDPWVTYFNQRHWYSSEPCDFGVRAGSFEQYIASHEGYYLNMPERLTQIKNDKRIGIMSTIYQAMSFSGNMGYEVIRKHPEFALYDANGQFAVDRFYAGYPNPMEIASPIEIGPKRQVVKPYLDRKITPSWGHGLVNTARRDVVEFEARAVTEYAKHLGFGGLYVDGNLGVLPGYGYDGKPNVPANDPVEYMKLGARNHQLFLDIIKKDNSDFGIWYNWSYAHVDACLEVGMKEYLGSGAKGDVGDENLRAAAARNSMFLLEIQDTFQKPETNSKWISAAYHLNMLADNRDQMMQKYGVSMVVGYLFPWPEDVNNPGANRWGWPTLNYFGAQFIATQHHFAGGFLPSMRPWLQFMTRYSRYLWAPDVKIVPEAEKIVRVSSLEEISWKRLVYKLKTAEGYELIVHLVRLPPTKNWDIEWLDEPRRLAGVAVTLDLGPDGLRDAWALRPYDFEENQQPLQTVLTAHAEAGNTRVEIPPFRYHTMVVFRVRTTPGK
jgi:hypothetical protein